MSFQIPEELLVEGIRSIEQHAVANHSQLLVPPEFDKKKLVGKWAFVGASAERAQLPQRIHNTDKVIDGWTVWKDREGNVCERPLGKQKAILLCRPKGLQAAVNAIYGNISKDRASAEQQGRTVEGKPVPQGVIPNAALKGYDPQADADLEERIGYTFNKIPSVRDANIGARGVEIRPKSSRKRKPVAT